MELIVSSKKLSVYNILTDLSIQEKCIDSDSSKAVAISNFDGQELGVLNKNNVLKIYSSDGNITNNLQLKSTSNCFAFFKSDAIVVGDLNGEISLYKSSNGVWRSSVIANQGIDDSIESINVSPGHLFIYCRHRSGKMTKYNVKKDESHVLKFKESVSVFDVSRWSYQSSLFGCESGVVARYDCERERSISLWSDNKSSVAGVSFSLHNKLLALSVYSGCTAALLACDTSTVIRSFDLKNVPTSCAFSDGNIFAVGDEFGLVSLFDVRMSKVFKDFQTENSISFVGFGHMDDQLDRSDISFKPRLFRETQNLTDSLSGNSLFSVDESMDIKAVGDLSFDLSQFSSSNLSIPVINTDAKRCKQVKFEDSIVSRLQSPVPILQVIEHSQNDKVINSKPVLAAEHYIADSSTIRKIVSEEIKKELSSFEFRLKNDLIFGMIDQLSITERNIICPLQELLQDNHLLTEENEILRQELRKYKYNV